jgi:DNA-binding XRE family transcriptional regulator
MVLSTVTKGPGQDMTLNTEIRSEALRSLYDQCYRNDPERQVSLEREFLNAEVARNLYELRRELGLTQEALAQQAGIDVLVIADLEESDFEGNSLEILEKICSTFGKRVELSYVGPVSGRNYKGSLYIHEAGL